MRRKWCSYTVTSQNLTSSVRGCLTTVTSQNYPSSGVVPPESTSILVFKHSLLFFIFFLFFSFLFFLFFFSCFFPVTLKYLPDYIVFLHLLLFVISRCHHLNQYCFCVLGAEQLCRSRKCHVVYCISWDWNDYSTSCFDKRTGFHF